MDFLNETRTFEVSHMGLKAPIRQIYKRGIQNIASGGGTNGQSVKRGEHVNGASAFPEPLKQEKEGKELFGSREP